MRSAKVMANAFKAGFHRTAQRVCPVPFGSRDRVTRYRVFIAACSLGKCGVVAVGSTTGTGPGRPGDGPPEWHAADGYASYTLRGTPQELSELIDRLDALIRPLIAATRSEAPSDAELVHVGSQAFPRLGPS